MIKDKVTFKNFSETDFIYPFDGKEYTFKAGQSYDMEQGEALHFQKHLVDRELTAREDNREKDKGKEIRTNNEVERKKLEDQCISAVKEEVVEEEQTEESKEKEFPSLEK